MEEDKEKYYLEWFYENCDFGPAHDDVIQLMNEEYTKDTGEEVPPGYE